VNKLLIFYPYSNVGTNPTMCALIPALINAGFQVDLIVDNSHADEFPSLPVAGQHCRELNFDSRVWWQPAPPGIAKRMWQFGKRPTAVEPAYFKRFAARQYCGMIGVDPLGIATAAQLNQHAQVPLIYLSFELLLSDECDEAAETRLKAAEQEATSDCRLVVIQDGARADLLSADNSIERDRFCYIPVAPLDAEPTNSDYLRQRLEIPADRRIVLFQGTIGAWSGRDEWEMLLSCWRRDIALVVHSRRQIGARNRKFLAALASRYPVYVSDRPVPAADLPLLTASADVGLVSYVPSPADWHTFGNLQTIGLASGKLATFLMCGVPVLANQRTSIGSLVDEHQLGASYDSVESSPAALEKIFSNHSQFSSSARAFYRDHLNPSQPIATFIARLRECVKG
jgi:hypothetical protein